MNESKTMLSICARGMLSADLHTYHVQKWGFNGIKIKWIVGTHGNQNYMGQLDSTANPAHLPQKFCRSVNPIPVVSETNPRKI